MSSKKNETRPVEPTLQREIRRGYEVICVGLDNIPVTNTELEVIETYAGDLIRMLISGKMDEEEGN